MQRRTAVLVVLVAFATVFCATGASAYENCNGVGYFALQIANPGSMSPDGLAGDWHSWFDTDFRVGIDQMCGTNPQEIPPRDDIDIAISAGWTPEPDNRLYVLVTVVDDTLNNDETNPDSGFLDDDMELILDPDHAGGWFEEPNAIRSGHQQWTFHLPNAGGYPAPGAFLRWQQPPEMQWAVDEGRVEAAVGTIPEGSGHGATDVTVNYEVRMEAYDPYMPGGLDASIRHTFAAGQTIGMSITINEADDLAGSRSHQISTHVIEGGAHNSDNTSEFTMLGTGDFRTAVESSTWGAVKALMTQ